MQTTRSSGPWWLRPQRGDRLTPAELDAIWAMMSRVAVKDRGGFEATLRTCEQVYLPREDGRVVGLICYGEYADTLDGRPVSVLYGHWYVLAPEARGRYTTAIATLRSIVEAKRRHPTWLVVGLAKSSTYNSYRMTLRGVPAVYPSRHAPTPPGLAALRDRVMAKAGGEAWDPATGVYRGRGAFEYLEGRVEASSPDPDAAFYATANPGQTQGDGLVLIIPVDLRNLLGLVWTAIRRTLRLSR